MSLCGRDSVPNTTCQHLVALDSHVLRLADAHEAEWSQTSCMDRSSRNAVLGSCILQVPRLLPESREGWWVIPPAAQHLQTLARVAEAPECVCCPTVHQLQLQSHLPIGAVAHNQWHLPVYLCLR